MALVWPSVCICLPAFSLGLSINLGAYSQMDLAGNEIGLDWSN